MTDKLYVLSDNTVINPKYLVHVGPIEEVNGGFDVQLETRELIDASRSNLIKKWGATL